MALPSSGALKFSDIKAEFGGGTPPANFRAYLKGGGYVSVGDSAPNVPTSGAMEIRDFLGAAKTVKCATPYVTSQGEGYCEAPSGSCTAAESVTVACATSGVTFTWTRTSGLHTPSSATGATLNFSKSNIVAIGGATVTSTYTCVASKPGNSDSDPLTVTVTTVHERV